MHSHGFWSAGGHNVCLHTTSSRDGMAKVVHVFLCQTYFDISGLNPEKKKLIPSGLACGLHSAANSFGVFTHRLSSRDV